MLTAEELQAIAEIQTITGIDNILHLNNQKFAIITQAVAEGKINKNQLKSLIQTVPEFVAFQVQATQELISFASTVSQQAGRSQRTVISQVVDSLTPTTKLLEKLAENVQSDSTKQEIAKLAVDLAKIQLENHKILLELNKGNNNFFLALTGVVGGIVGGIFLFALNILAGDNSST